MKNRSLGTPPYDQLWLSFRAEWRTIGTATWEPVETLSDIDGFDGGQFYLEIKAVPGDIRYRTGLAAVMVEEQEYPCSGDTQWSEVVIEGATEEELTQVEVEREILMAAGRSCISEALLPNVSDAAVAVLQKYAAKQVLEGFSEYEGPEANAELALNVLMLCSMLNGENDGFDSWPVWMFFGGW